jgi:hypothetical protein
MNLKKSIHPIITAAVILFISVLFAACTDDTKNFTLGTEFVISQTSVKLIDTFSVNLSTVLLDSITTSGTGSMLVGNYRDDIFGKIRTNSYFQVGVPESFDVEDNDTYDSLVLALRYNTYHFGDTTKSQRIFVHQLNENIKLSNDGVIYSGTTFNYNLNPMGSVSYTPKPNSEDTLFIRINNTFGADLFKKLKNGSEIITDNESFINYFHGLVLISDINSEGSIIGFNASKENVELILFTSREGETSNIISNVFPLEDSTKQFNNIIHDFSSTPLSPLVKQRIALSNAKTGGVSFLQGGIGLAIRVDIPSLSGVLLFKRGLITKAQLSIYPKQNSYDSFDLPSNLAIYGSNKLNQMNSTYSSSTLTVDKKYQEETNYSFDVTEHLRAELADSYVDPENGLLITLSNDVLNTTLYRSIINAKNRMPKLKIYYLSY